MPNRRSGPTVIAFILGFLLCLSVQQIIQSGSYAITSNEPDNASSKLVDVGLNASLRLAFEQSYGFFDDITEKDWKMHQDRAMTTPQHYFEKNPKMYSMSPEPRQWTMHNYEPTFTCPHVRRVGGLGDGPKWTCDPHRLARIASERKCLIYSIGSAGKFQWENGLIDIIGPRVCEIHVFDPDRPKNLKNPEESGIFYHQWGLKSSYQDFNLPARGEFRTMQETLRELGHTDQPIDILKVDCEICEWFTFRDWLEADVRQLLLETHGLPTAPTMTKWKQPNPPRMTVTELHDTLRQHNFFLYSKEPNWMSGVSAMCVFRCLLFVLK